MSLKILGLGDGGHKNDGYNKEIPSRDLEKEETESQGTEKIIQLKTKTVKVWQLKNMGIIVIIKFKGH